MGLLIWKFVSFSSTFFLYYFFGNRTPHFSILSWWSLFCFPSGLVHSSYSCFYFLTAFWFCFSDWDILYYRGSQAPGHGPVPVCGPLGTGPHSRRWAAGKRGKFHLYLQTLPIACITAWAPPPVRSAAALDCHRSVNPTVNCACEGSRLRAPYENLMPGDLRWSWGGDARAGERLQMQIIISREVWLYREHNTSVACRLILKPYQWVASDN